MQQVHVVQACNPDTGSEIIEGIYLDTAYATAIEHAEVIRSYLWSYSGNTLDPNIEVRVVTYPVHCAPGWNRDPRTGFVMPIND